MLERSGWSALVSLCLLALPASGGCSSRPGDIDRPAKLHGRVTLRGKPLADVMVFAVSEAAPTASPASAQTMKNGSYTMEGVPAGRIRIAVLPPIRSDAPLPCNRKFLDWRTSGLAADVVPGDQALEIKLE
jgi:hypothetical protein